MNKTIRKRHFRIFVALSSLLPLLVVLAIYLKVSPDHSLDSGSGASSQKNMGELVFDSSKEKTPSKVLVKVFKRKSDGQDKYVITVKPKKPIQQPDVLLYLNQVSLKNAKKPIKKLGKAVLLGELIDDREHKFLIDAKSLKKARFLVFYSNPFAKVVEEIRLRLG